jgi:hypothetical protein
LLILNKWRLEEASMTGQVIGKVKLERVPTTGMTMVLARFYAKQAVKEEIKRRGRRPHEFAARLIHQAAESYLDQHREELVERACAALVTFEQKRRR